MRSRPAAAAALVAVALLALLPAAALGHSELEASSPADGATVDGSPPEIAGDFSEEVDPARSFIVLRDADGTEIASGGVPPGGPATRMTIADVPALAAGRYEVRWTTVTPDDAGVERGTFTFTVAEAAPTPEATPAAATNPPASATLAPTAEASPATTPVPEPASARGSADLLIPIAALGVLLAGGAAWYVRRRR